jgi:hypothetical protein
MGRAEDDDLDFLDLPPKRSAREWQRLARQEPYGMTRVTSLPGRPKGGQKRTPEVMRRIVKQLSEIPVAKDACELNGVTTTSVRVWLAKSRLGQPGDGFDLVMNPDDAPEDQVTVRFHEAWDQALKDGAQTILRATVKRAIGYREPLTYQGRVIYQLDPKKVADGKTGMDAYLLDKDGRPVPESVEKQDPDLMQFLLKGLMPEQFGTRSKVEIEGKISGVLVVAAKAPDPKVLNEEALAYKKEPLMVEFEESDDDD